jgi:hypothetical protein
MNNSRFAVVVYLKTILNGFFNLPSENFADSFEVQYFFYIENMYSKLKIRFLSRYYCSEPPSFCYNLIFEQKQNSIKLTKLKIAFQNSNHAAMLFNLLRYCSITLVNCTNGLQLKSCKF